MFGMNPIEYLHLTKFVSVTGVMQSTCSFAGKENGIGKGILAER